MKTMLYVTNVRLPTEKAHGKQIMETCHALASVGVAVKLIAPLRKNALAQDPFGYYGVDRTFDITYARSVDFLSKPFAHRLAFIVQSFTFFCSAALAVLKNRMNRRVLYTRDLVLAFLFSLFSPNVFYEMHVVSDRYRLLTHMLLRGVSGVVVISAGLKDALVAGGYPTERVVIARDGVDERLLTYSMTRQEARKALSLTTTKKIVVYTGHLYHWKGASVLAEAAPLIRDSADVFLVGGTEADSENFRKKYRSPNLHIVGHRPPQEVPLWVRAADVAVIPNSQRETISLLYSSPLKLFEYCALGSVIVASDLPSLREVVGEKEVLFFTPDDAAGLGAALQKALQLSEDQKSAFARAGRDKGRQHTWQARAVIIRNFLYGN